jgi:hypothetical protein
VALPFTLKSILRQKENYGSSFISPCKNIMFKKSSERNQNPSTFNTSQNIIFQRSLGKIDLLLLPRGQKPLSYYTLQ